MIYRSTVAAIVLPMVIPIAVAQTTQPASQPATSQPATTVKPHKPPDKTMQIKARYVRLAVDDGQVLAERNYHHAHLDWNLKLNECALVLLDVWNYHYSADTFERVDAISRNQIVRILEASRRDGMQVIHGPAGSVATGHPNWVRLVDRSTRQPEYPGSPNWPPPRFKAKQGEYAQLRKPHESHLPYVSSYHPTYLRDFHDACRPVGDEAVILSGEELHRLCAQRGIVHLFYVGFNTNACMIYRTYGIMPMTTRGYNGIIIRDATTGMETADTLPTMACTEGIIATLEQFGNYSVSTDEIVKALDEAKKRR